MTEHMTKACAYRLLREYMADLGLEGWKIAWNQTRRQAGSCNHGTHTITISTYLLDRRSYMDSWQTVTHEIAHAAVGPFHKHDVIWRAKHQSLGGNGQQCHTFVDESAPYMLDCGSGCRDAKYRKLTRTFRCRKHRLPMILKTREQVAAEKGMTNGLPVN